MLNAIRVDDFKIAFAQEKGAINEAFRQVPAWPVITNLRADPFESAQHDSGMYVKWYADNMWMMVPAQGFVQKFLSSIEPYPFQPGSSLSAGNIGYDTLKLQRASEKFKKLLKMSPIN
jgi:arylsulfatase